MVRAPCCDDKMGLKKGPWTPEEDRILVSYIQNHGHGNWRALPLLSGLSRCGKSCRLRWINYLRPDIKRGNFTKEEEETIIQLHEMLGNRWSTIAAKLPGRTDNEIKNVWHTHLKKKLRLKKVQSSIEPKTEPKPELSSSSLITAPQPSLSETSSTTEASAVVVGEVNNIENAIEPVIDESFWSDPPLSADLSGWLSGSNDITVDAVDGFSMDSCNGELVTWDPSYRKVIDEGMEMDFWYNLFAEDDRGGHELPEF